MSRIASKRVLILSASAGAGHVRAGQALEKAFRAADPQVDARHVDVLELTNRVFRHLYSRAYLDFVDTAPAMMGYLYNKTDRLSRSGKYPSDKVRLGFDKLNTRRFVDFLQWLKPDLIVCTHFLPAEIVSNLKEKKRFDVPQAVVITDMEAHRYWVYPRVDRYFVASEEAKAYLTHLGIGSERVEVSGIPIDPAFLDGKPRLKCRERFGLDPTLPAILVLGGGFATGPIDEIVEGLLTVRSPVQVAVVTGRNDQMRKELQKRFHPRPLHHRPAARAWRAFQKKLGRRPAPDSPNLPHLRILGHVDAIDELMSAVDILVSKPGGLTTSEALAKGLPYVIMNPIPGQEARNSDYLLEKGAAVKASNPVMLAYKVQRLLENPAERIHLSRAAQAIAKPHAGEQIAQSLLGAAFLPRRYGDTENNKKTGTGVVF